MDKRHKRQLERMQTASAEEMQKNMEKLFNENVNLKAEMKELKTLAEEMQRTLSLAYRFTKSLSEFTTADNRTPELDAVQKEYVIENKLLI